MIGSTDCSSDCFPRASTSLFALAVVVTLSMAIPAQSPADIACLRLASSITFSQSFQPTTPSLRRWFSNTCAHAGYTRILELDCLRADYRGFQIIDAFSSVSSDLHHLSHRLLFTGDTLMVPSLFLHPRTGRFFVLPPPMDC